MVHYENLPNEPVANLVSHMLDHPHLTLIPKSEIPTSAKTEAPNATTRISLLKERRNNQEFQVGIPTSAPTPSTLEHRREVLDNLEREQGPSRLARFPYRKQDASLARFQNHPNLSLHYGTFEKTGRIVPHADISESQRWVHPFPSPKRSSTSRDSNGKKAYKKPGLYDHIQAKVNTGLAQIKKREKSLEKDPLQSIGVKSEKMQIINPTNRTSRTLVSRPGTSHRASRGRDDDYKNTEDYFGKISRIDMSSGNSTHPIYTLHPPAFESEYSLSKPFLTDGLHPSKNSDQKKPKPVAFGRTTNRKK